MSRLSEILASKPKTKKKIRVNNLRKIKKSRIRAVKFSKREGCFVVMLHYTKCQSAGCETITEATRLGCAKCGGMDIVWGALINTGKIEKNRLKCAVQQSEFITNRDLYNRILGGERFLEVGISKPKEVTVVDFDI